MKKYLNAALHKLTVLLEFIISFVLAAGIIILLVQLILSMPNVPDLNIYPNYEDLVETCFNLIIGVDRCDLHRTFICNQKVPFY